MFTRALFSQAVACLPIMLRLVSMDLALSALETQKPCQGYSVQHVGNPGTHLDVWSVVSPAPPVMKMC